MPAWVGGGDYWSADSIQYFVTWLQCVQTAANGTVVDFLGPLFPGSPRCH